MLIRKKLTRIIITFSAVLLTACSDTPQPVEVTRNAENTVTPSPTPTPIVTVIEDDFWEVFQEVDDRVTFTGYAARETLTLDPQLAVDNESLNYIENLFVQLTNYDPATAEIVPEAAESWEISEDGRIYTFHLRSDIPWLYHNPVTLETTQEIDSEGKSPLR